MLFLHRPDTYITSGMETHWKGRSISNAHLISLSYIGTNAGVVRSFPGVRWTRPYDPTTRPYYHRALASRGRLALSYAYFDAAGAGKVVTFSEVLYLGKLPTTVTECMQATNRPERYENILHAFTVLRTDTLAIHMSVLTVKLY